MKHVTKPIKVTTPIRIFLVRANANIMNSFYYVSIMHVGP